MASWSSPRDSAYRDSSPTSPLTPLSPSALPQWLRAKKPRSSVLSSAKLKTVCIVLCCVLLGWFATSTLTPNGEETLDLEGKPYDAASGGVLTDPSGFGMHTEAEEKDGIIGDGEDEEKDASDMGPEGKSSVTGALSELHHAASDKIQSWNPYHYKPGPGDQSNKTQSAQGSKKLSNGIVKGPQGEDIKDGIEEVDRLGARTRIGKCTILFNGNSFWERSIRTHEQHDKMHGYRLHVLRQKLLDDVWDKPAYILSLLLRELSKPDAERLEWLFWVDADTIILNPHIPIETFLPPPGEFDDVHLMYSNDWNGLNNGVFPIRVNQWSVDLFSAIVSYRYYRPEDPLVFRDQSAMNSLMNEPRFSKNIVNAPQRWFNAYQGEHNETLQPFQIRRGDLLVHFAGVPAREERMGYWLERAEQHLDDWEIPVKSTSYPQEARDFWAQERDNRKNRVMTLSQTRLQATQLLTTTDQQINEYGDRITPAEASVINENRENLKKLIENENWADNLEKIKQATASLTEANTPLASALGSSNRLLLNSAHEAIFAGEKTLLDNGYGSGTPSPDLDLINANVKSLKNLVMVPEESWNRPDITIATNALTEARARLQEKVAAAKAKQSEIARMKELDEARKMVQVEAGLAPVAETGLVLDEGGAALAGGPSAVVVAPHAMTAGLPVQGAVTGLPMASSIPLGISAGVEEVGGAGTVEVNSIAVESVPGPMITVTPEPIMVWATATVADDSGAQSTAVPGPDTLNF
ncbi:hypothetical protein B0A50_05643 [Salinomyces thailandicus]|uniref:Glycosyltransferase family 34 protein n=1 Tax=Salinomyces thailandicus TaxID=706561 RepID=A0A4U0TUG3_9PEZI|nr:hypothetical protein B0A50_05643 [Salinomyces thailandica]